MKFQVTRNHLMIALYVLGGSLILYGLLKLLFKIDFGPAVEQNFPTVVMVGAAVLFVWNRDLWKKEEKARREEEDRAKALEESPAGETPGSLESPGSPDKPAT